MLLSKRNNKQCADPSSIVSLAIKSYASSAQAALDLPFKCCLSCSLYGAVPVACAGGGAPGAAVAA